MLGAELLGFKQAVLAWRCYVESAVSRECLWHLRCNIKLKGSQMSSYLVSVLFQLQLGLVNSI